MVQVWPPTDAPGIAPVALIMARDGSQPLQAVANNLRADTCRAGHRRRGVAGGRFTPIRFPGAPNTLVTGLNDRGQLVGAQAAGVNRSGACSDNQA
jgi:hypothetical protein